MLPASHLTPIVLGVCVSVGAKVTLLEKEAKVGGNSAKATSGINGWGTMPQAVEQIHDEERHFERDTFRSGKGGTALAHASLMLLSDSPDPKLQPGFHCSRLG